MRSTKSRRRRLAPNLVDVRDMLTTPFAEYYGPPEYEIHDLDRLYMAFGEGQREIHRRRLLKGIKVTGLWWFGPHKVQASYTFCSDRWCYVREDFRETTVDIEGQVNVSINAKKNIKTKRWWCCTVDEDQYRLVDAVMGPREEVCNLKTHKS